MTAVKEATGARLAAALEAVDTAKQRAQREADRLRAAGWSWRQIGEAAGVTGMAARKRWDPGTQSATRRY